MENIQNNNNNIGDEEINIVEMLHQYIKHWKWFVLSAATALVIGVAAILYMQKGYQSDMSILLNEDKKGGSNSALADLEMLGLLSSSNNLDNELVLLQSPDILKGVVDTLNLQTVYYTIRLTGRKIEEYKDFPFVVKIAGENAKRIKNTEFYIKKNKNRYTIFGTIDDLKIDREVANFPVTITLKRGIVINITPNLNEIIDGKKYYVQITSQYLATKALCDNLNVTLSSKTSSVLNLSLKSHNADKGAVVLTEIIKQYNMFHINIKNEIAYNTSIFINERLKDIAIELGEVEDNLLNFKKQNNITDIRREAAAFVEQTSETERRMLDIETQLSVISMVENFLSNSANRMSAVPNLGISDASLTMIINEYNTALLMAEKEFRGMGEDAPRKKQLLDNLSNIRSSIIGSLQNVKQSYYVVKNELQRQTSQNLSKIHSVPTLEIGLIERTRKQQIIENLFLFLMQKREENNLSIASTPNKARIVVSPSEESLPVSPKSKVILLAMLIVGIVVPFGVIYLKNLLNVQISSRHELEKLSSVSVIGQIAKSDNADGVVVQPHDVSGISEMFRSLRNNINFILKHQNHKTILVTSTTQGEGKTFIAINIAVSYAFTGKKILLVGGDIRNPKLKAIFNMKEKQGLSNYLASDGSDWHDYIYPSGIFNNLEILPAGVIPPNPNELLMGDLFKKLMHEIKQKYDFVIIDSAPVGLVSDTYFIASEADMTVYVVREDFTPKDAVNFMNTQKAEGKLTNMYLVLNNSHLDANYKYGYGSKYGYRTNDL